MSTTCNFKLIATTPIQVSPQLQWIWYSKQSRSFIVGDDRRSFSIAIDMPNAPTALSVGSDTFAGQPHPYNLPLPDALYREFAEEPRRGLRFLEREAYLHAVDAKGLPAGDLLRTIVFGPDYNQYQLHAPSGSILSLRSRSMALLQREGNGYKEIDRTKPRGSAVLCFAAHPTETLLAYGDNNGDFHAHRFAADGFGKATKIASRERKASRLEFIGGGEMLIVGGMGYLSSYQYESGKFTLAADVSISVRDFTCINDGELIFVNQGMHGISVYRCEASCLIKLGAVPTSEAVFQIAVTPDGRYLAATTQDAAILKVYELSSN